jgi:hypothetical protein
LRRFGFPFAQGGFVRAAFAFLEVRQRLFILFTGGVGFLFLLFGKEYGPAGFDNDRAFGLEFDRGAFAIDGGDFFQTDGIEGGNKLGGDGIVNDLLISAE